MMIAMVGLVTVVAGAVVAVRSSWITGNGLMQFGQLILEAVAAAA